MLQIFYSIPSELRANTRVDISIDEMVDVTMNRLDIDFDN